MKYIATTKSDPSKELTHWKYIKREKVNGKWRYYYDSNTAKTDANNFKQKVKNEVDFAKQEASRSAQNLEYEVRDKALEYMQKKSSYSDDLAGYTSATINRGYNSVLKSLNNIGKGTLDDSLDSFVKTVRNKINKLFYKAKNLKLSIFNKSNKKNNKPTLSDPNEKILKENVIKENVIKENIIR